MLESSTPDAGRWERISDVWATAAELPTKDRAKFLDRECAGEPDVRREVESLLAASAQADGFLTPEHLRKEIGAISEPAHLFPSGSFGRYEISHQIGAGATGDVYLATDPELGRRVAIKVLSHPFGAGDEAQWRFVSEARAASALNHPNIVTVYEIGQVERQRFIATEFIEGTTLRARMASARLTIAETLDIAIQIAAALAAAHKAGIVHRDIKPENIMLRPDGLVKVVDFGLALSADLNSAFAPGVVAGTPRYMSPEQKSGLTLDGQTDIYSLGVVAVEMLGGDAEVPPPLKPVLARALESDRERRYQTAQELASELTDAQSRLFGKQSRASARILPFFALALAVIGVTGVLYLRSANDTPSTQPLMPIPFTSDAAYESEPRISPDGNWVAYTREDASRRPEVVLQEVGSTSPARVIRKEAFSPAWSPDGRAVAVLNAGPGNNGQREVSLVSLEDLSQKKVGEIQTPGAFQDWVPGPYLDFSPDGRYLVAADGWHDDGQSSLVLLSTATGSKVRLTTPGAGALGDFCPRFAPDGKKIAFMRIVRFGASVLHVADIHPDGGPAGQSRRIPSADIWNAHPTWTSDGQHIIHTGGGMRVARLKTSSIAGEPASRTLPIQEPAVTALDLRPTSAGAHRMVYTRYPKNDDIIQVPVATADPEGNTRAARVLINSSFIDETPVYSPDGAHIAFLSDRTGSLQVWVVGADGSSPRQVTNARAATFHHIVWSPDGKRLAFQFVKADQSGISDVAVEGGEVRLLAPGDGTTPAYSPDGKWLYFASREGKSQHVWRVPSQGGDRERAGEVEGDAFAFSPNGKTLVFARGLKLFMRPATGGPATLLFPLIYSHQSFRVTDSAVYAVAQSAGQWALMGRKFKDSRNRLLATYPRQPANGMSVSPDDRYGLLTQREHISVDLMLVENVQVPR